MTLEILEFYLCFIFTYLYFCGNMILLYLTFLLKFFPRLVENNTEQRENVIISNFKDSLFY